LNTNNRTWLRTASGRNLDLARPNPETILFSDIARALGNLPRFGGHTRRFYSCACHSITLSTHICQRTKKAKKKRDVILQIIALLYDAHDAYFFPLPWTTRSLIKIDDYDERRDSLRNIILGKIGIEPKKEFMDIVDEKKKSLLKFEMEQLLNFVPKEFEKYPDLSIKRLDYAPPQQASMDFLCRLRSLRKQLRKFP
jgi:5'-nucleotidase